MTYAFPGVNSECNVTRAHALMSVSPAPGTWCGGRRSASVVVVESDSAGPSATVTEVRNMVVLESKSERSRRLPSPPDCRRSSG